jgi:hypothetical protein
MLQRTLPAGFIAAGKNIGIVTIGNIAIVTIGNIGRSSVPTNNLNLSLALVIAAAARGLNPGAVLVRPSVQLTESRARCVKHRAELPPAYSSKLIG